MNDKAIVENYLKTHPNLTRHYQNSIIADLLNISMTEVKRADRIHSLKRRLREALPNDEKGFELENKVRKEYGYIPGFEKTIDQLEALKIN